MENYINGRNVMLYKHDDATNTDIPFACAMSCTLQLQTEMVDVTDIDSAFFKKVKPNLNGFGISGSGFTILNTQWNYLELIDQWVNRTKFTVKFVIDNGGLLGLSIFSGTVYLSSYELTGNDDQLSQYSFQLAGTGVPSTSGATVTPTGSIIISGTTMNVFQYTATGGETSFVPTNPSGGSAVGMTALYGSRGGMTFQPFVYAGTPTGNGGKWVTASGSIQLPSDNPAVNGEYFLILAQ